MPYRPSIKLELNNSRFPKWSSINLRHGLNELAAIDIQLTNPVGQYTTLPFEDMPIKFWLGWDTDDPPLRFDGTMDDPNWSVQKTSMNMGLSGRDFGKILFDENTVDENFEPYGNPIDRGFLLEYIRYINQNLSTPITELFERNITDDDNENFQYSFENLKCLDALKKLVQYGNYEWLMLLDQDDNRNFAVRPQRDLIDDNVAHAFIVGERSNYNDIPEQADVHHVESINVKQQYGFKKNYIKVKGEGVEAIYPLSPPSIPKHLLHEDSGIISSGDALQVAQRLWTDKAAPKTLVDFSGVGVETLRVGDIIYVNDFRYGASTLPTHLFRLIQINDTINFGSGWKASFKVADYVPSMFQFFSGTIPL